MENGSNNNKVAFLLLCHGNPKNIVELLELPYFNNPHIAVFIHYDLSSSKANTNQLREYISAKKRYFFVEKRVKCEWGMFSLVEATINMIESCLNSHQFHADHLYLISAACVPVKPFENLQEFLSSNSETEFIEANDVRYSRWVTQGWDKERAEYYFPFSWYRNRKLFELSCRFQEKLSLNRRKPPIPLNLHFGSQWFCLTRSTSSRILEYFRNKKLKRFFKLSWIPDEFAIQTLCAAAVSPKNLINKTLTYYEFNSYGRPNILYNDHETFIKNLPYFFARKVSPEAKKLKIFISKYTSPNNVIIDKLNLENVSERPKDLELHQKIHKHYLKLAKTGLIENEWNDGLDKNTKKYYVLSSISMEYLKFACNLIRKNTSFVVHIDTFKFTDKKGIKKSYNGFKTDDFKLKKLAPINYLYQIINQSNQNIILSHDPINESEYVREVIRWSHEANILIIEPKFKNETEKLVSQLNEKEASELLKLPPSQVWIVLKDSFINSNNSYWQTMINKSRKCYISWIEDDNSVVGKKIVNLLNNIPLEHVLSNDHLELIDVLNKEKIK